MHSFAMFVWMFCFLGLAPELSIDMPLTQEEWDTIYRQYKCKSTNAIMAGGIACIDGFF
jgi:hypothetical protein